MSPSGYVYLKVSHNGVPSLEIYTTHRQMVGDALAQLKKSIGHANISGPVTSDNEKQLVVPLYDSIGRFRVEKLGNTDYWAALWIVGYLCSKGWEVFQVSGDVGPSNTTYHLRLKE